MEASALIFIVIGLLCGTFGAALGLGSGVILVPILVLLFQFDQKAAQGTCLAMMVPMALVGAWRYKHNPEINIDLIIVLWLSIGAVFGALLGAAIAGALPVNTLRRIFAVVLLVAAGRMLFSSARESKPPGSASNLETSLTSESTDETEAPRSD